MDYVTSKLKHYVSRFLLNKDVLYIFRDRNYTQYNIVFHLSAFFVTVIIIVFHLYTVFFTVIIVVFHLSTFFVAVI